MLRVVALLSLLLCCGCLVEPGTLRSRSSKLIPVTSLGRVAVIPFDGQMAGALERDERVVLLPQDVVAAALAPKEGEVLAPKELGELLKAETLLLGTVSEYRYKRGVGEEPVVGLSLRLVKAKTGAILWRGDRTRIGTYSWWREDSLSRLGGAVCRELARELSKELQDE
ncbi:MAG: hypothetical protein ACYTGH_22115 [Planctomycetota bacterium]|jgi:hypothetical protein